MSTTTLTVSLSAAISLYDNLGAGYGGKPFTDGTPMNSNAPPPGAAQFTGPGSYTIDVPGPPYTCNFVWVKSPPGSTNLKTAKGASGDVGLTQSNGQSPMCLPVAAGGTFVIVSQQAETVELVYG